MRVKAKRSARGKRSARSKARRSAKRWPRFGRSPLSRLAVGAAAIFAVLVFVSAAGILLSAREPSASDITMRENRQAVPAETPARRGAAQSARPVSVLPSEARVADLSVPTTGSTEVDSARTEKIAPAPVTIAGCLVKDDEAFQLTDTTGAGAPQGRSWKSGFLRRRSVSVNVIDATNHLRLPSHLGQRVSVTGQLDDREIRARSLQLVSPSCS